MMVNSDRIRLRPAKISDRPFLVETRESAFRAYVEETGGWDDAEQRATADVEFAKLPVVLVEEDGEPIGYLCVIHNDDCDDIDEIALVPGARGRGIGTQLLRAILDAAHERGVPVRLSVFANNPARALYARLGFAVTRTDPPRVKMEWNPTKA